MRKDGKRLTINKPKFGNKQLVSEKQDKEIRKCKISFSLLYFNQISYFQIGDCSKEWYVGLIQRLKTLGTMDSEYVRNNGSKALRYHDIDWNSKNIPIKRDDINWLPSEILNNEEEFPIVQISISTGTGRIIGFFDSGSSVFHIVMLDPYHNLQPSKSSNYQTQPTHEGYSQYDNLLCKLDKVKSIVSSCPRDCKLNNHIKVMDALHSNIVYFGLDDEFYKEYQTILENHSISDIIEAGIAYFNDNQ